MDTTTGTLIIKLMVTKLIYSTVCNDFLPKSKLTIVSRVPYVVKSDAQRMIDDHFVSTNMDTNYMYDWLPDPIAMGPYK